MAEKSQHRSNNNERDGNKQSCHGHGAARYNENPDDYHQPRTDGEVVRAKDSHGLQRPDREHEERKGNRQGR
ncbi:MAG: hypothetical protein WBE32_08450 [Pseudolabrys sp.]|jgi:hypothetical protein